MKQKLLLLTGFAVMTAAMLSSCEKPVFDDDNATGNPTQPNQTQPGNENQANLVLSVSNFVIVPYEARQNTRAVQNITDYCKRFNFVIYQGDTKVKSITQKEGDEGYGEVALTLEPGTYKVLVLAHSSTGGNPSLANPEEIKFTNADGYSDTFYYYDEINVTTETQRHDLTLSRATSKLNFIISDQIPQNVKYVTLYYTGGSGVLNATTGYGGNVNSQQTVLYNIEGVTAPVTLPAYTFLQNNTGNLQLTVTAQDAGKNTIVERKFTNVPMKRNMVTEYSGTFFDHESENGFTFTAETDWEVYEEYTYSF